MKSLLKTIASICFIVCASCKDDKKISPLPEPPPQSYYDFVEIEQVFGFYGQSRYSYAPSLVKQPDGTIHMYFCGNPDQLIMVDHIYHVRINPDGSQTAPKSVVQPGVAGSFDDHHICDPSVIAGEFSMAGESYKYAMFYLTNRHGVYYNEIGVAFSNDLEADSWVKYPAQLVGKPWEYEGDEMLASGGKSWGVGQPSAVSLDEAGHIILTYTIGDINGTRIAWVELDLSDMDSFVPQVSHKMLDEGLLNLAMTGKDYTCNSDFAIDRKNNVIVMVRPVQPHPTTYPMYLNESLEVNFMPLDDFLNNTGRWESMVRISPYMTGFARNHNAGLERDPYGNIEEWKEPVVYYTVSKESPDVRAESTFHAEWTYHIWRGKVSKTQHE